MEFYTQRFSFKPKEYWLSLLQNGQISVNQQGVDPDYILKEGDLLHTRRDDVQEPDVNNEIDILHDENGVFVINKPAPLPVHPVGRFYKNTLIYILNEMFPDRKFHTIHRIDVWTTGVLVMGSEPQMARKLHSQVEKKAFHKSYGVLAVGDFGDKEFTIDKPVGRIEGAHRGTGPNIVEAKEAQTVFTPIAKNGDVTLLKAKPITGRTHQIRVHVQAAGGHVLNDPFYSPGGHDNIEFMGLHCREMGFRIGDGSEITYFKAPWPQAYKDLFKEIEMDDL